MTFVCAAKGDNQKATFMQASQPPPSELNQRLRRFREVLRDRKLSAALIVEERNVRYLSGFTGEDSALLVTPHEKFILTDFRFVPEAQESARGWQIVIDPQGIMEKAGEIALKERVETLAIEPGAMRLTDLKPLRKAARGIKLRQEHGMVGELRLCKSAWEVQRIEAALRIQEACFLEFCAGLETREEGGRRREEVRGLYSPPSSLFPLPSSLTERDAAARLRYMLVMAGADDQAFDTLFQIGINSSRPHGRPTHRALNGDALVLFDWGARLGGYHSDLTRTFFVGKIPSQLRQIHRVVLDAQQAVVDAMRPGVELAALDKIAHEVVDRAGYKEYFCHSTGHGIGLSIHEPPSLSSHVKGALKDGMVLAIEPGIYMPGRCGIRVEDLVLVTKSGARVLSGLKKGLRWDGSNE
ncbi:MAG TPA: Xaa-Pro peptidase family protein [Planctomycetota bacterium]|nr:Xaa-Pro peptidase family protein [Planctomycetota bacterium]